MKSRKAQIAALQLRIKRVNPKFRRSLEIKEASGHIANAKSWTRRSEYHWTEAIEEAHALIRYIEETR